MSDQFNLNTNEFIQQCDDNDVMSLNQEQLYRVRFIKNIINRLFINNAISQIHSYMVSTYKIQTIEKCEILKAGSTGWQKGKIKINVTLEFIPDEPETPESILDDVRQELNVNGN